jgi:anti-sigma B factor antagonist
MSAEGEFHIVTRHGPDRLILELDGELDMVSCAQLDETLSSMDLDECGALVLDLRGVRFLDSTGLKAIFKARSLAHERGQKFAVTQGSTQVQRLLSLTRLDRHLDTIDTPDAVLA